MSERPHCKVVSITESPQQLSTSVSVLRTIDVENPSENFKVFLKLWDRATEPDPASDPPCVVIGLLQGAARTLPLFAEFRLGCWIAATQQSGLGSSPSDQPLIATIIQ